MSEEIDPRHKMTESDYLKELELFATEVDNARVIYHTYEEMNCISLTDNDVFVALNKHALFWNAQIYSLQTSLMIVLGRIFDTDGDVQSVHTVMKATLANLNLFSRESLRRRKSGGELTAQDIENFLDGTWEPADVADLRPLKKAVSAQATYYRDVYRPIRDKFLAHRVINDPNDVWNLFAATNRTKIGETIEFLVDLVETLRDLYHNGIQPTLGGQRSRRYNQEIRDGVKDVLDVIAREFRESNPN